MTALITWPLGLGVAAALSTLLGGLLALRLGKRIYLILGFSAGAVIGVALFDLLPEALDLGRGLLPARAVITALGAGLAVYMTIDRTFAWARRDREGGQSHLRLASLALHSFLDGLGIGLAFQVSPAVGGVVAIAVLAHDLADGVNTVNVTLAAGGNPRMARAWLSVNAMAPLVGVVVGQLATVPRGALSLTLGLFAGVFLYIGAAELLPQSYRQHPHPWTTVATILGLAVIFAVVRIAST